MVASSSSLRLCLFKQNCVFAFKSGKLCTSNFLFQARSADAMLLTTALCTRDVDFDENVARYKFFYKFTC